MNNKSPAFQFYPDKWQSHTRRLSDSSYRMFHELLCWMWQHSEDHCSIQNSPEAVACALAMPLECVRIALAEVQNSFSPLLKEESGKLVSNGLRKEAEKQDLRRTQSKRSANARWNNTNALRPHTNSSAKPMPTHSERNANASVLQCLTTPSPALQGEQPPSPENQEPDFIGTSLPKKLSPTQIISLEKELDRIATHLKSPPEPQTFNVSNGKFLNSGSQLSLGRKALLSRQSEIEALLRSQTTP